MDNNFENKINSIIQEIEATNKMIDIFSKKSDSIDATVAKEFSRKKKSLLRELLSVLIQSNLSFYHFEGLHFKILNYLKKEDFKTEVSNDFLKKLNKVESFVAV